MEQSSTGTLCCDNQQISVCISSKETSQNYARLLKEKVDKQRNKWMRKAKQSKAFKKQKAKQQLTSIFLCRQQ